jgi:hypothetical protein
VFAASLSKIQLRQYGLCSPPLASIMNSLNWHRKKIPKAKIILLGGNSAIYTFKFTIHSTTAKLGGSKSAILQNQSFAYFAN